MLALSAAAQVQPSTQQDPAQDQGASSSTGVRSAQIQESSSQARIAQPEVRGSAITLETSEPLFDLAVGLNACGYDADLAASHPVRLTIRQEVNDELLGSAAAREARDALCTFMRDHTLTDRGLDLAQYVSLALYTNPPPALSPSVSETELPPDAEQIANVLTPLRAFNEQLHLHSIWVKHLPEYQALVAQVHDPLTQMILETNVFLRLPVSSYDGRRFLVLLEPMLAPSATNARIYASDYIAVSSPAAENASIHMEEVRHIYLQYMVEPLVYARSAAMDRLLPLLKAVYDAPIDFIYKSDITALITECLIRAIEAHTLTFDFPRPAKPTTVSQRTGTFNFDSEMTAYSHKTEALRRQLVERDMREGWALTGYFYDQLANSGHDASLKEEIGPMVYGMDVDRERKHEQQIVFLPRGSQTTIHRAPVALTGLRLAESKLIKGDLDAAEEIAQKTLDDPKGDHAEAHYVLGQVDVLQRLPDDAVEHFNQALQGAKNPRTLAWSHIYLGRLYDTQQEPDRTRAVAEYRAALTVRDSAPDTKAAAEKGIKSPFSTPKRVKNAPDDDAAFDPSGKAEKEAYRPGTPQ